MLSGQQLDRLCVVLVRARNSNNIGAAARAMRDFGFGGLCVVNEYAVPFEAARSAVDASDVLAHAARCTSVAEAVAGCTLVVGTTAVGERALEHQLLPLPQAALRIRAELQSPALPEAGNAPRVALLFGSEKTGLSNEEMSHCHWLLTIPMHQDAGTRHVSMDLGQAVAVCLYELVRDAQPAAEEGYDDVPSSRALFTPPALSLEPAAASAQPATAATLERVTAMLSEVMQATEYTRRHAANSDPAQVRRLVRRIGMDAVDAPVWMGILRQVLWKLGRSRED